MVARNQADLPNILSRLSRVDREMTRKLDIQRTTEDDEGKGGQLTRGVLCPSRSLWCLPLDKQYLPGADSLGSNYNGSWSPAPGMNQIFHNPSKFGGRCGQLPGAK